MQSAALSQVSKCGHRREEHEDDELVLLRQATEGAVNIKNSKRRSFELSALFLDEKQAAPRPYGRRKTHSLPHSSTEK